jgi:hypothetical protein
VWCYFLFVLSHFCYCFPFVFLQKWQHLFSFTVCKVCLLQIQLPLYSTVHSHGPPKESGFRFFQLRSSSSVHCLATRSSPSAPLAAPLLNATLRVIIGPPRIKAWPLCAGAGPPLAEEWPTRATRSGQYPPSFAAPSAGVVANGFFIFYFLFFFLCCLWDTISPFIVVLSCCGDLCIWS